MCSSWPRPPRSWLVVHWSATWRRWCKWFGVLRAWLHIVCICRFIYVVLYCDSILFGECLIQRCRPAVREFMDRFVVVGRISSHLPSKSLNPLSGAHFCGSLSKQDRDSSWVFSIRREQDWMGQKMFSQDCQRFCYEFVSCTSWHSLWVSSNVLLFFSSRLFLIGEGPVREGDILALYSADFLDRSQNPIVDHESKNEANHGKGL